MFFSVYMGTKDLVDGKNPAPLGVSQKVLRDIYLNFMVQDFFHQQYHDRMLTYWILGKETPYQLDPLASRPSQLPPAEDTLMA